MLLHGSWSQELKFKLLDMAFKTFHDLASVALYDLIFQYDPPQLAGCSHASPLVTTGNLPTTPHLHCSLCLLHSEPWKGAAPHTMHQEASPPSPSPLVIVGGEGSS